MRRVRLDLQRPCDADDVDEGDVAFGALDLADVVAVVAGQLGEALLGEVSLRPQFAEALAVAAAHIDSAVLRNGVSLSDGIQALINEALNFADGLRFTDAKLRASLVDTCDQVYALAPGVARTNKSLTPHIDAMRHASRRKGGRKKPGTPPVATATAGAAPPAWQPTTTPVTATAPVTASQSKTG